jgi:hypothetical protein
MSRCGSDSVCLSLSLSLSVSALSVSVCLCLSVCLSVSVGLCVWSASVCHCSPVGVMSVARKRPAAMMSAGVDDGRLRVGTDFSGTESPLHAMSRLGIEFDHKFACDSAPCATKLIQHTQNPGVFYPSVKGRSSRDMPETDLYIFSPPCQAFSAAGLKQGIDDLKDRGDLIFYALDYVRCKRPAALICENVPDFATNSRFKHLLQLVVSSLEGWGYSTLWQILNVQDYGLPQHRPRFFLMGVRVDKLSSALKFPPPTGWMVPLPRIVVVLPAAEWQAVPGPDQPLMRRNVLANYDKIHKAGVNAFDEPCVIDAKSSERFSGWRRTVSKCLTKSRCESFGYWISTKGGPMDVGEMELLQGFEPGSVDWEGAGISKAQWAGMLGNAVNVNVLVHVIPFVLRAAGLCSQGQFERMRAQS